ncbi:DUF448 domain-containing protein [Desulfofustis glycolicus]|uniref:DUF448 domain-containing protein n=1 Tax=Desulfofustis glycolicus TaxID=51195 RepID=UPI001ABF3DBB|nr:DUF448 domain-containing protein [Desulfobulbaceae bacterium]
MTRRPIRTCVSCRRKAGKGELLRHCWRGDGPVADERQVAPGRGVYTCSNETCMNRFYADSRRWQRLFRRT